MHAEHFLWIYPWQMREMRAAIAKVPERYILHYLPSVYSLHLGIVWVHYVFIQHLKINIVIYTIVTWWISCVCGLNLIRSFTLSCCLSWYSWGKISITALIWVCLNLVVTKCNISWMLEELKQIFSVHLPCTVDLVHSIQYTGALHPRNGYLRWDSSNVNASFHKLIGICSSHEAMIKWGFCFNLIQNVVN